MPQQRAPVSKDPAGQISALISFAAIALGTIVELIRWLRRRYRQRQQRVVLRQLYRAIGMPQDPETIEKAIQAMAAAGPSPAPILSKPLLGSTVGDFFAYAAFLALKLFVGLEIVAILLLWSSIHDAQRNIVVMEALLK